MGRSTNENRVGSRDFSGLSKRKRSVFL